LEAQLKALEAEAKAALAEARDLEAVEAARVAYLGRKGKLTAVLSKLGDVPSHDRPRVGRLGNEIKQSLAAMIEAAEQRIKDEALAAAIARARIDVTLPGFAPAPGHVHPITQTLDEMVSVFEGLGFWVEQGPDVETDCNNFEALNIGKDHPARDMQATFFVSDDVVLRTHTSPVQIRTMKQYPPPVRVICPGRVYRCDSDLSHSPMFHQLEGFMVDDDINFGHLKGVLMEFIHAFFGTRVGVRFRPSYFPFTEPSAEVDIECVICGGKGCPVCKRSGWIEILGSGMIHPQVLKNVGYDPEKVTGFAFGMGVERIAMLKFRIDSIRAFFENDLRFLRQF
jgi:phenylalanyl-tRNA synthetase alpha chain